MVAWELGLVALGAVAIVLGGSILGMAISVLARGGSRQPWMEPSILLVVFVGVTVALVGVTKLITEHGVFLPMLSIIGGSVLALAATNIDRLLREAPRTEPLAIGGR
jgi:hypothetical protein